MTRWQTFYQDDTRIPDAPPSQTVQDALPILQQEGCQWVLDLGCGAGRDTLLLAASLTRVVGLDRAPAGLALTRQRLARLPTAVPLLCADARQLPIQSATMDAVSCYGLLHECTSTQAEHDVAVSMAEIVRVLRPGGLLILTVLAGEPSQALPHVRLCTLEMLQAIMQPFDGVQLDTLADRGCTGSTDYTVHRALGRKRYAAERT